MIINKIFYAMRHGETTDNALGLISGAGSDPHLTERGRDQARAASLIFSQLSVPPSRIVTSALRRTHQTAELVIGHTDFIIDPDLNERHLGQHDGKISEVEQNTLGKLPGEESNADHARRVIGAVNAHLERDELTLFICHGGTIRRILEAVCLKDKIHVGNAEIYRFIPRLGEWFIERD